MDIVAVGGLAISVLLALIKLIETINGRINSRETVTVQRENNAIVGYEKFCNDLQEELDKLRAEMVSLRGELVAAQTRLAELERERAEWTQERADLRRRIESLEQELEERNRRLQELEACEE